MDLTQHQVLSGQSNQVRNGHRNAESLGGAEKHVSGYGGTPGEKTS